MKGSDYDCYVFQAVRALISAMSAHVPKVRFRGLTEKRFAGLRTSLPVEVLTSV